MKEKEKEKKRKKRRRDARKIIREVIVADSRSRPHDVNIIK